MDKYNTNEFIEKSIKIHGNKYDYSLVVYNGTRNKIKIICPEHGIFEQITNNHLNGRGCPKCVNCEKMNNDIFIKKSKKIHGDKYDYSLIDYKNRVNKIKIICSEHGIFEQIPYSHLRGNGCLECSNLSKQKLQLKKFIDKSNIIHNYKYDYSLIDYKNSRTPIEIICPIHGIFKQIPKSHTNSGCPRCNESKGEKKINNYLLNNKINFETQKTFKKCKYKSLLKFDFYLPIFNCCIEYDGEQHFRKYRFEENNDKLNIRKKRDQIKNIYCKNNYIKLYRIKYDENIIEKLNMLILNEKS